MLLNKEMLYLYKQVHYVCGQSVAHKWQTPLTFPQVHHAILPANSSFDLHSEAHFFANELLTQELSGLKGPWLQHKQDYLSTPPDQFVQNKQHSSVAVQTNSK